MIRLIATVSAALDGKAGARRAVPDLPEEAVGAQVGSRYHIAPWILETLANELLSAPKQSPMTSGRYRELRTDRFAVLDMLARLVIALENAEDGMFLAKHDVFTEMHRLVQRQFPWQRGSSAPALYRSLMLYGTGNAASYFERETGLKTSDFVKVGAWLASALSRRDGVRRETDLYSAAISPDVRDRALRRLVIGHEDARGLTRRMRAPNLHTAYKPSILRDFPIIAFGDQQERLRAPLPALITRRFTDGHYLDVVGGGAAVWTEIGKRFEQYCVEYLAQMLAPYDVCGERLYGPKKTRRWTPDILVSKQNEVVFVAECKAKRMTFEARFAEDPIVDAATGYAEIAKGIFQIWRFLSHARRGVEGAPIVRPDCLGILITIDPWLAMARNQEEEVFAQAHTLADAEGHIIAEDRRHISVCLIDDVEFVLQNGDAETFLTACRELTSDEKKGWVLSVAHAAEQRKPRPYPFADRIGEILPWWSPTRGEDEI